MGVFWVFTFLSTLVLGTFLLLVKTKIKFDSSIPALLTAKEQVYYYGLVNGSLPDSVSIDFYKPFYSYTNNGNYSVLRLFGKDKKEGTADDIVEVFYEKDILPYRYKEVYERARIIAQTAYALCQRRLANNEYPIWAPNLNTLFEWTDLPPEYKYTPFGHLYNYDVSSCKKDYCYCNRTIVWASDY